MSIEVPKVYILYVLKVIFCIKLQEKVEESFEEI